MYLKDIVGNTYKQWKRGEWVFISSPTGTGKTTFVLDQLVPEAKSMGKEVMMLSNRTILRDQVKNIVARKQGVTNDSKFLKDVEEFDGVTLMSYQKVQALMERNDMNTGSWFEDHRYMYVVLDEAHYILEDSMFNPKVYYIEEFIKRCNCTKIMMSATIEEVQTYILGRYLENKVWDGCEQQVTPYITVKPIETFTSAIGISSYVWFVNVPQYSHNVRVKYFDNYEQLVGKINSNQEKWLIFISNKSKVTEWKKKIKRSIETVSAEDKEKIVVEEIISEEKFSTDVLVTTKLLDNGVNFKDGKLKNLVIDTISRVEFLQMIGRKRLKQNEEITVYIPKKSKMFFVGYDNLHFAKILRLLDGNIERRTFVQEMLDDPEVYDIIRRFFVYLYKKYDTECESKGRLMLNAAGEYKVHCLYAFVQKMEEEMQADGYAFIKEQLKWLGVEEAFDMKNDIAIDERKTNLDELKKYLFQTNGIELDKDQQSEFRERITEYMRKLSYEFKTGRIAGKSVINTFFDALGLEFYIDIRKSSKKGDTTKWFLRRKINGVAC